jgi:hypothetical protein
MFAQEACEVEAKRHDVEFVSASKIERGAREFSGEAVAFERRRNFCVRDDQAIGKSAVAHESAEPVHLRFEAMGFFVVDYGDVDEIQVHLLACGFF